jgi:glutathione S-transferase
MIELYDYPKCPFCRKVRITLLEKGIKYKNIFVDLKQKEQKRPEFLQLNPLGKVPVLVHNSMAIYESTVINEYLEEVYPDPSLLPSGSFNKARARILVEYCENNFHLHVFNIYKELNFKKESERNIDKVRINKNLLSKHLSFLNDILDGKDYLAGSFSLADIAFMPRVLIFDTLGIEINEDYVHLIKWISNLKSRKSSDIIYQE